MSEWNYIVAAYALTWVALIVYAVQLARRMRRAARDLTTATNGTETER